MPNWKRVALLALTLTLITALIAPTGFAFPGEDTTALAKKGKGKKGKKCRKGFVSKTVVKHGKKVKVCRKKVVPPPPPPPPPKGLFEAPGMVLEGEAAKPFLQKYLANSTFTDCPSGWGVNGCSVEQRYSHAADGTFHYCRLTSSSGSDIRVTDEYGVEAAKVEPDGSWTFREVVNNSGNYSKYEWSVSTTGVVNGAYQFTPSSQIEHLGPYVYIGGVAKDCSY